MRNVLKKLEPRKRRKNKREETGKLSNVMQRKFVRGSERGNELRGTEVMADVSDR